MWAGNCEDYLLASLPAGNNPPGDYMGRWTNFLPRLEPWRLNTMRLAFRFADAPATHHSILDFARMDEVISFLSANGFAVVLNCHNWQDHYDWFGSQAWINDWVQVANHYKRDSKVLAYELFNEPFPSNWASNVTTALDVPRACANCIDAIRTTGDNHAILLPDPMIYGDSSFTIPAEAIRSNTVLGKHLWCSDYVELEYPGGWEAFLNDRWTRMLNFRNRYGIPLVVGEFGCYPWGGTTWPVQKAWMVEIVNRCLRDNVAFIFTWWGKNCHYCNEIGHPNAYDEALEASNYAPSNYIVAIRTSPPINALVTVDGSSHGTAPVDVQVAEGMHTVSISKEVT